MSRNAANGSTPRPAGTELGATTRLADAGPKLAVPRHDVPRRRGLLAPRPREGLRSFGVSSERLIESLLSCVSLLEIDVVRPLVGTFSPIGRRHVRTDDFERNVVDPGASAAVQQHA